MDARIIEDIQAGLTNYTPSQALTHEDSHMQTHTHAHKNTHTYLIFSHIVFCCTFLHYIFILFVCMWTFLLCGLLICGFNMFLILWPPWSSAAGIPNRDCSSQVSKQGFYFWTAQENKENHKITKATSTMGKRGVGSPARSVLVSGVNVAPGALRSFLRESVPNVRTIKSVGLAYASPLFDCRVLGL